MIWSRPELQVLFVCTANICRSPLAEGLLRHRLRNEGLAKSVQVRSAGTAANPGLRSDPRAVEVAAEAGVPLGRIRSQRLTPKLLSRSDYILVMDRGQLEEVSRMSAALIDEHEDMTAAFTGTLALLGSYLPASEGGTNAPDIPDPYFGDVRGFRYVHDIIDRALEGFMEHISSRLESDSRGL
ncbi:MAG: low molecular weight protein-tyrosine-phosphatase [Gammaproteobacteria bacterium]|nr:low molecular weight phosphotyrosine protein phosphatase [Pseudomonadales bacterium]MCP5346789.1 low molecular weight phosphotyrosine protein phosphatase [Pseudomonadales bacterium]